MKKLSLIILLVVITMLAKAQTTKPIDGFLGIKFGSSQAQVIEALKAKGAIINNSNKDTNALLFDNVKLGDRSCSALFVNFIHNQVYEAQFLFRPELESKSIDFYNTLLSDISGVYGSGKEYKKFKDPYKEGDGYEITAIKTGNADYSIFWQDSPNYIGAR